MPEVTIKAVNGSDYAVDGEAGTSIMELAVRNDVPGIIGECGGSMACGTCRVTVDPKFAETVGPPGDFEAEVLEGIEPGCVATDRLSCQLLMALEFDGLLLEVAEDTW